MRRARQTAAGIKRMRYVVWRALREIEVGVCDGMTYAQVIHARMCFLQQSFLVSAFVVACLEDLLRILAMSRRLCCACQMTITWHLSDDVLGQARPEPAVLSIVRK